MNRIPADIFRDVLLFLNRSEVEKNQLVCQTLNKFIKHYISIIPLHIIDELIITKFEMGKPYASITVLHDQIKTYELIDGYFINRIFIESLKHCIIMKMIINISDFQMITEVLMKIISIINEKLHVMHLETNKKHFKSDYSYENMFNFLNYINAYKITRNMFSSTEQEAFLANHVNIPDTTKKIKLFFAPDSWGEEEFSVNLPLSFFGRMLNLFENGNMNDAYRFRLELVTKFLTMSDCNKMIELYMNVENPNYIARSIKIFGGNHIAECFINFIQTRNLNHISSLVTQIKESFTNTRDQSLSLPEEGALTKETHTTQTNAGHKLKIVIKSKSYNDYGRSFIESMKIKLIRNS